MAKLTRKQKSKANKAAFRAKRKASPAKRRRAPKRAVRKANRAKARVTRRTRGYKTFGYGVSTRRGRPWVTKLAGFSLKKTNPRHFGESAVTRTFNGTEFRFRQFKDGWEVSDEFASSRQGYASLNAAIAAAKRWDDLPQTNPRRRSTKRRTRRTRSLRGVKRSARTGRFVRR